MFDLNSITSSPRVLPPRIGLLGTPKVGKTTFGAESDRAILIPITGEEGADGLTCPRFPTVETWADLEAALETLCTAEHNYGTVVIDSTSALERVIFGQVCADNKWPNIEHPGYGKGYAVALPYWDRLTKMLDYLRVSRNVGCILIGHVKTRTSNDPLSDPYDQYQWDINQGAASLLTKWVDCILFARLKAITKDIEGSKKIHAIGDKRRLYTQERPGHPGGGRGVYGHLPYELPLSYAKWAEAVSEAFAQQQNSIPAAEEPAPSNDDEGGEDGTGEK